MATSVIERLTGSAGKSVRVLEQSGVASSVTGTTVQTALKSITIPGGSLGAGGSIRVRWLVSCTNNANSKPLQMYLGGVALGGPQSLTNLAGFDADIHITARNAENSQVLNSTWAGSGSVIVAASSVDLSQDQDLEIRTTLSNATDTVTLEAYSVEVLP